DGELADEHFAATVLRTREHAVLTDIAGADVQPERRGGAVRNHLELRRWSIGIIVGHGGFSLGLSRLLRGNDGEGLALPGSGELLDQRAKVRRLQLFEPAASILRRKIPRIGVCADERAYRLAIAEVNPVHGDDFIDDRRQLAPGLCTLDLR